MSAARRAYRNIPFNPRTLEYVVGIVVVLIFFFGRLERSSLGRAMDSIHQDETAAEVMGIDVVRIKLLAFGSAPRSRASPARFMRIRRPSWTRPPSTSCCRWKS